MTKNIVIVGAGLTGLSIAKILNKEKNICLIEASNNLGGILSSIKFDKDYFDFGTHFLRETGVKTLDRILFKELKKKWANYLILLCVTFACDCSSLPKTEILKKSSPDSHRF